LINIGRGLLDDSLYFPSPGCFEDLYSFQCYQIFLQFDLILDSCGQICWYPLHILLSQTAKCCTFDYRLATGVLLAGLEILEVDLNVELWVLVAAAGFAFSGFCLWKESKSCVILMIKAFICSFSAMISFLWTDCIQ